MRIVELSEIDGDTAAFFESAVEKLTAYELEAIYMYICCFPLWPGVVRLIEDMKRREGLPTKHETVIFGIGPDA